MAPFRVHPTAVQRSNHRAGLLNPVHWVASSILTSAERQALVGQLPVRDQMQTSECVAETSSELRTLIDIYNKVPNWINFSENYIYGKGHILANDQNEGMQPVWAMTVLQKYGDIPETMNPLAPTETVQQSMASITPAMDQAASSHTISAYGPVTLTGDGTVGANAAALSAAIDHFPILIAVPVATSGMLYSPVPDGHGGFVAQYTQGSMVDGGHAILAYDYRNYQPYAGAPTEFQILCRNSWGAGYGAGGNVWLGGSYPLWEAWSVSPNPVNPLCAQLQEFLDQYGPNMPQQQILALQQYMQAQGC